MMQKKALKCFYPGFVYADILNCAKLVTLKVRRELQTYFGETKVHKHIFNHLLPDKRHTKYDITHGNGYPLPITRTNKYRNSLICGLYKCM